MAVFHITSNNSRDIAGGNAFDDVPINVPGILIVDAKAFLVSESGGFGAELNAGPWTVTINGLVQGVGAATTGLDYVFEGASSFFKLTVGGGGDIFGGDKGLDFFASNAGASITNKGTIAGGTIGIRGTAPGLAASLSINNSGLIHGGNTGVEHNIGTMTLVNSGTIFGNIFSIHAPSVLAQVAHIRNSGVLIGNVLLSGGADTFTDFKKVGHVIKSGIVLGSIDLGDGDDHFNGGVKTEFVRDGGGADNYNLGGGSDIYFAVGGGGATGADTIDGGKGIDTYQALGATFTVLVNLDTKAHGGLAAQSAQGADVGDLGNTDKVIGFENVDGGSAADLLIGSNGANSFIGQAGTDDLIGLGGRDILFGGDDGDRFIFQKLSDSGVKSSTRDLILDFTQGQDHMRLVDLEASVGHAFAFIGTQQFHHAAGELRQNDSGANTIVSLDSNGDGKADFSIELTGHFALTAGDFTL